MVDAVRITEQALGVVRYGTGEIEESSKVFRRSLFVVEDLKAGEVFTAENVRVIRPGYGLPPKFYDEVIGRAASRAIKRGTPLEWHHLSGG